MFCVGSLKRLVDRCVVQPMSSAMSVDSHAFVDGSHLSLLGGGGALKPE